MGVRRIVIGGELGGPKNTAYASSAILVFLWILYVVLSSVEALSKKVETGPYYDAPGPITSPE